MSAIYEMCSRALLSRTRFVKQRKKPLPFIPPSPKKRYSLFVLHSLLVLHSLFFSPTALSFALQEKMFKNKVLVTSGKQRVRAVVGEPSIVCVCVCLCVRQSDSGWLMAQSG